VTADFKALAVRFLKFGIVGGSGVFVNLGIYVALTRGVDLVDTLWGRNLSYAISVEISILTNFLLNDLWTFADRRSRDPWLRRLAKFHVVSMVGFGINWGVFAALNWLMVEKGWAIFGELSLMGWKGNLDDLCAAALGIAAAMFWNFFANLLWTWKESR